MPAENDDEKTAGLKVDSLSDLAGLPPRLEVRALIGQGAMGMVFQAHDLHMDRDVAVKILLSDLCRDAAVQERFLKETKALAALDHANIVRILSSGLTENGALYFVMELLSGESLAALLRKERIVSGQRFHQIFSQLADALAHIHALAIVHRDLKPGNIMLGNDSDGKCLPKIIDFGIARCQANAAAGQLTAANVALGTPAYMSPEQCRGGAVNHLSDIYSLGCIMYECLSGRPPLPAETAGQTMLRQINDQPERLRFASNNRKARRLSVLVDRCLRKDPGCRPQSAKEIKLELDELFSGKQAALNFLESRPPSKLALPVLAVIALCSIGSTVYLVRLYAGRNDLAELSRNALGYSAHTLKRGSLRQRLLSTKKIIEYELARVDQRGARVQALKNLKSVRPNLEETIKEATDSQEKSKEAMLFAALQMKFEMLLALGAEVNEQADCQDQALALCSPGTPEANWCAIELTYIYLEQNQLDSAEKYINRVDAKPAASEIPEDLWIWKGSRPEVRAAIYRGEIASKRGDFAGAEKSFAAAARMEIEAGHLSGLAALMHDRAASYSKMSRRREALASLSKGAGQLCRLAADSENKKDLSGSIIQLAGQAVALNDRALARKILAQGISCGSELGIPSEMQAEMKTTLSSLKD
jgi:serine/threonine protein kinase